MKCLFCESERIDFTCEKCNSSFCVNHATSTERWECKKHNIQYSKASAIEHSYKCSVVENSTCPECGSILRVDRLSSGHHFLQCTNCEWNSYIKTPGLFFPSKETLAREAKRYGIIKELRPCNKRLKEIPGKEICPKCFLDLLKRAPNTNFSTIMNSFNITADQMINLISKYMDEERIHGITDQQHQIFYYISSEIRDKIHDDIITKGVTKVADLATMLDMSTDTALKVMYKLINQFQIQGTFSRDKKIYYTQKYITDTLVKIISTQGRVTLKELSTKHFTLPIDQIKTFCVNLMRAKSIQAFFADRGNEIITSNQIVNDIKTYAKEEGLFKLTKLAEELKIAVELARKSIHTMIKNGSINGIFTQRREFMTRKHLELKIKEFAKAYRNMSLRDLSNRLGVTETRIEENLRILIGRGEIDGYIDSQKGLFVAYTVSAPKPKETKPEKDSILIDQDKIEILREYDFIGGQLHFKVVVRNYGETAIHSIKVLLDAPSSYTIKQPLIGIPVIEPGNTRGVDFYLEPKECGLSDIGGTVIYKDAKGTQFSIPIRKKEVQIKCPLVCTSLSTIEDCQLSIQSLAHDARAFLIADLDPRLAFRAGIRTLKNFETSMVTSYEGGEAAEAYEAEAWFCAEAKVTGGRIITRVFVSATSQSLEVRVWCANPGQLTGFLAKIIELLFEEINIIRKIKSDEREKTIDVMAITQNLAEISDYCMLRWKAQNIRNKLHDTFIRVRKILGDDSPILGRMEYWLTSLNKYGKDDNISEEDADKLVNDIENFRNIIARQIKL